MVKLIELSCPRGSVYCDLIGRKVKLIAVSYLAHLPIYLGVIISEGEIETELYHDWELKETK